MNAFLVILIIALVYLVVFQISKASEYVTVLKGEEKVRKQNNKINGFLMVAFLVAGLIGAWYCNHLYYGKTLFVQGSASLEGEKIDTMLWITLAVTGVVFVLTQAILFGFAYKYQESDDRKAVHFAHSTKLELIWTVIPAIVLTALVAYGIINWLHFTGPAPKGSLMVEVTGHQFGWEFRYPSNKPNDSLATFGRKDYKLTTAQNSLGVDFSDKESHDDVHVGTEMHVPVGRPVKLIIHAQDVIHDVGLSHFRMKMDAVPGIPTTMWFTPIITTKEMRLKTNNPEFNYEISCDQMCGKGHYSMRGLVIVETQEEYEAWLMNQKPKYRDLFPQAADTVKPLTAVVVPGK